VTLKQIFQTAGQARVLREVARQGLLPYPTFFASTKPFGTPLAPVALKYVLTVLVIVAIPGKDAFNFIVDLISYPYLVGLCLRVVVNRLVLKRHTQIFHCAMVIGVWILRRRRILAGIPPSIYQVKNAVVGLSLLSAFFLLVMPWYSLWPSLKYSL
jgi:hypothetical protein